MKSSNIGGQAVLEGIMMKNQDRYAVAVRKPDGEIFVQTETFHSITGNWKKLTTIPFVRGVFNFIDSMVLGIKTLTFSASFYEEEEEKETDQQPDMLQDRGQWDLSGDIIDCFRRYFSELSPEEQEEIIKGIEEGLTDQDVKRYFTLVGAEKMRQYRRVLMVAKIRDEDN